MPSISTFYGITIMMRFNDHEPPHVHAKYAECMGSFLIKDGSIIEGNLPSRAEAMVTEWILQNKEELLKQWETKVISKIPPLK